MKTGRFVTIVLLLFAVTTLQAEETVTAPGSGASVAPQPSPEAGKVTGGAMVQRSKMHGGSHGGQMHGGGRSGKMHGGKGSGMKHEMMQHRQDMEKRIRRIEERLEIIQTMLEQLLQR